jgi:hypothetical protein
MGTGGYAGEQGGTPNGPGGTETPRGPEGTAGDRETPRGPEGTTGGSERAARPHGSNNDTAVARTNGYRYRHCLLCWPADIPNYWTPLPLACSPFRSPRCPPRSSWAVSLPINGCALRPRRCLLVGPPVLGTWGWP